MRIDKRKIEIMMAKNNWTQRDAIKNCGISKPTFSKVMNGADLSPKVVGRIARGLKIDVEEIVMTERIPVMDPYGYRPQY